MVYESDFYTTRRPYRATPSVSSYTVSTPRHYVVTDYPSAPRRAEEQYSYSYNSSTESSSRGGDPYSRPSRTSSTSESVQRSYGSGPGSNYSYSTERSSSCAGVDIHKKTIVPSRQIRILPGIGKVHVVHSYDRIIPYIGHKRLTVIPAHGAPHVFRVRPSVIVREIDRITHKARPYIYYTPSLIHSEPLTYFDSEASLIRAQTQKLLRTIHTPVPRVHVPWPLAKVRYHYEHPLPARITSEDYIQRMLTPIKAVKQDIYNISHFITEPIRKYIGNSWCICPGPAHLACVRYSGGKAYSRRRNNTLQEIYSMQSDNVRKDIQLLSYYVKMNQERKAREGAVKASGSLNSMRPSRHFSKPQMMLEPSVSEEMKELREQRAERLRKIQELETSTPSPAELEASRMKRATKKQEEERLAEERALAEEKAKKEAAAKKEAEARRAELARQEALAAQAAAERQAELDRQAELAREAAEEKAAAEKAAAEKAAAEKAAAEKAAAEKAAAEKAAAEKAAAEKAAAEKAAAEKAAAEAAEKARLEEEKRQEEERQALLRLEEIARQAEEEKERELARQAEELAELARQEAELAEQAKREAELAELAKQEAELAELERQEKELAELDKQDREAAEVAKEEAELAEQVTEEAEVAAAESNIPAEEPATEEELVDLVTSPEPTAEAEVTESEADPEPIIEEPDTPEVQEDAE